MKRLSREELVPKLKKISDRLDRLINDDTISDTQFDEEDRVIQKMIDVLSDEINVPYLIDYYFQYDLTADEIADAIIKEWEEEDK